MAQSPFPRVALVVGAVAAVLDLATKAWAWAAIPAGTTRSLFGDWFLLCPRSNPAGPWSLGLASVPPAVMRVALPILSVVAVVVLLRILRATDPRDRVKTWGLALILGGAAGNLWDRAITVFDPAFGGVRDFLLVRGAWFQRVDGEFVRGDFPAFNLADTWITVGVVLVGWRLLFEKTPAPAESPA